MNNINVFLDDLRKMNGQTATSAAAFGNSWALQTMYGICPDAPNEQYSCQSADDETKARDACSRISMSPFTKCHAKVCPYFHWLKLYNLSYPDMVYFITFFLTISMGFPFQYDLVLD